jgi:hypothetical protein
MTPVSFTPLPPIIRKLIPRLGSTYDGEVIATARAVGRALHGAGQDWHDLARAAAGDAPDAPRPHTFRETEYAGRVRDALKAILDAPLFFNDWSLEFAASILVQDVDRLSEKQTACLNRLLHEAVRKGVVKPYHP